MNHPELELTYESARSWALQPASRPPPGWAHIVRHGLAIGLRERAPLVRQAAPQGAFPTCSPLLTIIAAMMVKVCR